jgi:HPt (histidine-containing phosphotransfer) domain-containing protein
MATQSSFLNKHAVLDRIGGDESLLGEIAIIFLQEYPELMSEIRAAIASGDAARLERSAHSLKGAVSNFCVQSATQAAFQLETMGRRGELQSAPGALRALEQQITALGRALSSFSE